MPRDDCIGRCLSSDCCEVGSARVGPWILELDHSSDRDARLIGASQASRGGRITNVSVPTDRVGCLLRCRNRIHEELVWGAIGRVTRTLRSNPRKNRNQSTRQRCHPTTHEPGRSPPRLRSGSTEGPAPPPLPSHRPSPARAQGRCDGDGGGAHRPPLMREESQVRL